MDCFQAILKFLVSFHRMDMFLRFVNAPHILALGGKVPPLVWLAAGTLEHTWEGHLYDLSHMRPGKTACAKNVLKSEFLGPSRSIQ